MTKTDYYVRDKKLPSGFDTKIIMRMFENDEVGMLAFLESYNDHKIVLTRFAEEPSEEQYLIAKMRKDGKTTADIARERGVGNAQVMNAIKRVAVWEYLKA